MAASLATILFPFDLALFSDCDTSEKRPKFIVQLRRAIINIDFPYLKKPRCCSGNHRSRWHFLGYSRFAQGKADHSEQIDFVIRHEVQWKGDSDYFRHTF
ncbi:hypothetical protein SCLCIDRAFT_1215811 [Scleroderma citrinum Foug A]|uniref:Uncharacterized protein n=1 Tax=Scleroderma citrinum Foug A TaxID=1036808 RepID=A0A0C3DZS0_9AGAM|nr:hypothetical protein SCLCIDRAFT_1215811 [Scleroderma citrinum Foug A]